MRRKTSHVLTVLSVLSLCAIPWASGQVFGGGIVNVASFAPVGLPNAKIAQGSLFAVFGSGLSDPGVHIATTFPLPTEFGGVTAQATVGGVTTDCIILIATPGRLTLLLPSDTPEGEGTLTVRVGGQTYMETIEVCPRSFGIFTKNQAGTGTAIMQNFVDASNQPVNGFATSANPGQLGILWGTGAGPVQGDEAGGPLPGDLQGQMDIQIFVGGVRVTNIIYIGRSGCCAATDQVIFEMPAGVSGCALPVVVVLDGVPSNAATISVASEGNFCSDAHGFTLSEIQSLLEASGEVSIGIVGLKRLVISAPLKGFDPFELVTDSAFAEFWTIDSTFFDTQIPPVTALGLGSCSTYTFIGENTDLVDPFPVARHDAGNLRIMGPSGDRQIDRIGLGEYFALLNPFIPPSPFGQPYFVEGAIHTVTGSGGDQLGSFEEDIHVKEFLPTTIGPHPWTNRGAIAIIVVAQKLLDSL